ncbi:MAG: efflux RND transporter periplasmic adaptor subunit, partial [Flavobacteriales bacterium]
VTNFSVKIRILPESYAQLMNGQGENFSPFKPGMSATVDIVTEKADRALSIPIKAVASRDDTTSASILDKIRDDGPEAETPEEPFTVVFVRNSDTDCAEIRVIQTGIQDDKFIQILSGISENEEIITGPYEMVAQKLKPGDHVKLRTQSSEENTQ